VKPPIGFVLVTHNNPDQTLFLCERLNRMFADPPIAIHHDFSQTAISTERFPANVRFVENWVRTGWGNLSVIDALLAAVRTLYDTADPDWFVSLSAVDYPIQTADFILRELRESDVDIYLDTRPLKNLGKLVRNQALGEQSFRHPMWQQLGFNRYAAIPLLNRKTAVRLNIAIETFCLPFNYLIRRLTPFGNGVQPYGGDAWFTANRRVAHVLLEQTPLWKKLHHHYRNRIVPEESFYHTLVGNTPGLKICTDNKRYTDWRGCFAHPRTLGREDFPRLLQSTHHFARKFKFDPEVLRELDEAVAQK
jgi:hypothetical protein